MKKYRNRIADKLLKRKLQGKGAVLIEGPKWCGKTTTAEQCANSVVYMDEPGKRDQNISLVDLNPNKLLQGDTPRLLDEWQITPKLWDAVRFEVDHRGEMGQFILTGSSVPVDDKEKFHSGTGRFSWLTMRPMSLYETEESNGSVSLSNLFNSPNELTGNSNIDLDKLAFLVCRGGWPQAIDLENDIALDQAKDYYDGVVNSDINRVDGIQKNPDRVKRIMRSYARNQGTQITNTTIVNDVAANEGSSVDQQTVALYLEDLRKIFVIDDVHSWNPNLRSKTAIRSSDTKYFVDPSIAVAALGIGPNDLIDDLKTFGFLFETMCIRDLKVYASALDGEILHYRDKTGLECDAVIHLRNGEYGLVEIKLGGSKLIDEGAETLLKLKNKIDTDKMKAPSFLMVLTGVGDYAYMRKDGISIVPVGCLKE